MQLFSRPVASLAVLCVGSSLICCAQAQEAPGKESPAAAPASEHLPAAEVTDATAAFAKALEKVEVAAPDADAQGAAKCRLLDGQVFASFAVDTKPLRAAVSEAATKSGKLAIVDDAKAPFALAIRVGGTSSGTASCTYVTLELIHVATGEARAIAYRCYLFDEGKRVEPETGQGQGVSDTLGNAMALSPTQVAESAASLAKRMKVLVGKRKPLRVQLGDLRNETENHFDMTMLADAARASCSELALFVVNPADYPGLEGSEAARDKVASHVLTAKIAQPRTGKTVTFTLETALHETVLQSTSEFRVFHGR